MPPNEHPAAQKHPRLGITMAEAQRRAEIAMRIIREQGVSIMPAIRKDRERRGL